MIARSTATSKGGGGGGGHIFRKIGRRSVMKARRVVGRVQQEAAHLEVMKRWIPTSVKREVE
ncbi:uncharacterized protein METZ01_LOCUS335617, partial [marine metagenome]